MNRSIKILLLADGIFSLAVAMIVPIYGIFVENIGGDIIDAGYTYAVYSIMLGVVTWFLARWEDHKKHKERLVFIGYLIRSFAILGYLLVHTPIQLLLVQSFLGLSEAFLYPLFDGLFSRHIDKGKDATEWGSWESVYHITTGVGAIIGGVLASRYSFKALFFAMFLISVISPIILYMKQRTLALAPTEGEI